jgi:hypothetical protein
MVVILVYFVSFIQVLSSGFSKDEISFYKNVIFSNVFLGFRSLIDGAELLGTESLFVFLTTFNPVFYYLMLD